MAMVAGGQLGLVQGRARGQSESGSLEKLRKDTSERQPEASGRIYRGGQEQGGPFLTFIRPTPTNPPSPGCLTWGEEGGGQRLQLPVAGNFLLIISSWENVKEMPFYLLYNNLYF